MGRPTAADQAEGLLASKPFDDLPAADAAADAPADEAEIAIAPVQLVDHVDDLPGAGTADRVT